MRYLVFITLLFIALNSPAQLLEGYWEGKYNYYYRHGWIEIDLKFEKTDSNAYKIYSYTYLLDELIRPRIDTLKVYYEPYKGDSIYLEEVPDRGDFQGAQSMWLKLKKENNDMVLRGRWEMADPSIPGGGEMYFRKVTGKIRKNKKYSF